MKIIETSDDKWIIELTIEEKNKLKAYDKCLRYKKRDCRNYLNKCPECKKYFDEFMNSFLS